MNKSLAATLLAVVGSAAALLMPGTSNAGNVGYFENEGSCPGYIGDPSAAITAAGHTPVALANLNAASLAPPDGLVYNYFCAGNFVGNADVNNAVANGMDLFLNLDLSPVDTGAAANFPGAPAITVADACSPTTKDSDLAPGSPIATGTAGTLTNSSLDGSVMCSSSGYVSSGPLPGGFIPLLTSAGNTTAFSYTSGSGRVVIGLTRTQITLPEATLLDTSQAPVCFTATWSNGCWAEAGELPPPARAKATPAPSWNGARTSANATTRAAP